MNDLPSVCFVMVSIRARQEVRARTLEQFTRVGIPSIHVIEQSDPPGELAIMANQIQAIRYGLDSSKCWIVYCEDDLSVAPIFPSALQMAVINNLPIVTFYLPGQQFYPATIRRALRDHGQISTGLYRVSNRRRWFGSQSVFMRRDFAERLSIDWKLGFLDTRIACLAPDSFSVFCPNPIQHYGAGLKSTWSSRGKPHHSISYQEG